MVLDSEVIGAALGQCSCSTRVSSVWFLLQVSSFSGNSLVLKGSHHFVPYPSNE